MLFVAPDILIFLLNGKASMFSSMAVRGSRYIVAVTVSLHCSLYMCFETLQSSWELAVCPATGGSALRGSSPIRCLASGQLAEAQRCGPIMRQSLWSGDRSDRLTVF